MGGVGPRLALATVEKAHAAFFVLPAAPARARIVATDLRRHRHDRLRPSGRGLQVRRAQRPHVTPEPSAAAKSSLVAELLEKRTAEARHLRLDRLGELEARHTFEKPAPEPLLGHGAGVQVFVLAGANKKGDKDLSGILLGRSWNRRRGRMMICGRRACRARRRSRSGLTLTPTPLPARRERGFGLPSWRHRAPIIPCPRR